MKKQNVKTFIELVDLEQSFSKTNFTYNGVKYSTFIAKDGNTPMIKSFSTGERAVKYSSFMFKVRASLGVEQPKEHTPVTLNTQVPPVKRVEELDRYIVEPKELSKDFLDTLQLSSLFLTDYTTHPNIKAIDFKALNDDHAENKLRGVIPVLFFQDGSKINIRYKWNGTYNNKGWYTLKGRDNVGAYLPHIAPIEKSSTLILVEGFKDGINANIAFPKCDILVADSKNAIYDFSLVANVLQYKKIIFFQDLEVSPEQMLFMVQGNKESEKHGIRDILKEESDIQKFYSKMSYIDYSKVSKGVTDPTDWIESLNRTRANILRNGLAQLKKALNSEKFISVYNRDLAKKIDIQLERAKRNDNKDLFMRLTLKKLQLKVSIQEEFNYYVSNLMKTPNRATVLNLDTSKFLSKKTKDIFNLFKKHSHILLGSPTGTGKSSLVLGQVKKEFINDDNNPLSTLAVKSILEEKNKPFIAKNIISEGLPLFFDNIIVIAPLTEITKEMGQHPLYTYVERTKLDSLEADLNAPYIALTTDTYELLKDNPKTKEMMRKRIDQAELIAFDEQHYAPQVKGFRGLVVKSYKSLQDYKGNVLYMSGTPIYAEATHAHPVTATLSRQFISKIKYHIDPFKDEKEVLESMRNHLKDGSILFYCKSKTEATYIHNLLMQEGKTVVKITSELRNEYLKNGVKIDKNELAGIKESVVYVATTKATTGANLKNLIAIYQHGTAYDPNTFIQLTARLRGNGFYYLLKVKGEKSQNDYNQNKAIHLSLLAKRFNVKSLGGVWHNEDFKDYLKKKTELPYKKNTIKDFLSIYRDAFQLIQSEGLGKLTDERDDFEFTVKQNQDPTKEPVTKVSYLDGSQIKKAFVGADVESYVKYFERKLIDWITRHGDIEELNRIYNLSFDYIQVNNQAWGDIKAKVFITDDDQREKELKQEEQKEHKEQFISEFDKKFNGIITAKQLKEQGLSDTNLNKLLEDKRLDQEKYRKVIKAKLTVKAKVTSLQFHLIPRTTIINATIELIQANQGAVTLKEISDHLEQHKFLTTRRAEAPFKKFLKDFFESEDFVKDELVFKQQIKVNGLRVRDVVTLPKETLKKLKATKDQEKREKALKIKAKELNELTQKYESYTELLRTTKRHKFYNLDEIKVETMKIKANIGQLVSDVKSLKVVGER